MACGSFLTILLGSGPAWGHAIFPTKVFPADSDQRIVINVAHERAPEEFNIAIDVSIPTGWKVTACEAVAPWKCRIDASPQVLRYSKDAAAGPAANDESFSFTARTGPPNTYSFPTNQTYNSGEKVGWVGPVGSEEPAPVLKTEAGAAAAAPATSTSPAPTATATASVPTTTPASASATAPAPATTPATTTAPASGDPDLPNTGSPGEQLYNLALMLVIGGAVVLWSTDPLLRRADTR